MKYFVTIGGQEIEVEIEGDRVTVGRHSYVAELSVLPGTPIRQLLLDGRPVPLAVQPLSRGRWAATDRGERWEVEVLDERTRHIRSLTGGGAERHGKGFLRAPMPGLVVRVSAAVGQAVGAGTSLVVLEAMKMENELRAPAAAVVRAVLVEPGQAVEKGEKLIELE